MPPWFRRFLKQLRERRPEVIRLVAHRGQPDVQTHVLAQKPLDIRVDFEEYYFSSQSRLPFQRGQQQQQQQQQKQKQGDSDVLDEVDMDCGLWWCRKPAAAGPLQMFGSLVSEIGF